LIPWDDAVTTSSAALTGEGEDGRLTRDAADVLETTHSDE
jgi:hypothetical protein